MKSVHVDQVVTVRASGRWRDGKGGASVSAVSSLGSSLEEDREISGQEAVANGCAEVSNVVGRRGDGEVETVEIVGVSAVLGRGAHTETSLGELVRLRNVESIDVGQGSAETLRGRSLGKDLRNVVNFKFERKQGGGGRLGKVDIQMIEEKWPTPS